MVSELRPRGIGEILDTAVGLYRARFTKLVAIAASIVVPVQILSALVLLSEQPDRFTVSITGTVSPQYDSRSAAVRLAAVVVVALVSVLSTALITAVCTRVVADAYIDKTTLPRDAARAVRPRVFAIAGTALIVLICEGIGLLVCLVGVLFPLTLFAVALPVLILEGIGVSAAIGRSVTLTKAHAMHVLGLVLTAQLLALVLNGSLALGVNLLVRPGDSAVAAVVGQSVAGAIAGCLTTPFIATAIVVMYFDLRIREEAFDVQLMMQRNDARLVV